MQIYPAIDLRGGQCVRLRRGDFAQETVFSSDPADMARRWVEQGATYLHLVDLDGARAGQPVNEPAIRQIVETAGVPCQLGGGLRTETHIRNALGWGVARVILGSRALRDPDWVEQMSRRLPQQIVVGIDARNGMVASDGWLSTSETSALALARHCASWPLAGIVYTDISRDGMLDGPNVESLAEMAAAVTLPVIASGGVTSIEDICVLAKRGLAGCIIGRALCEGKLELSEAIRVVSGEW